MAENNQYLHERHSAEYMRMPPVLMGVASAAIGFAFHETSDRVLDPSLWPVLAAVLLWAASFACGAKGSQHLAHTYKLNSAIIDAQAIGYAEGLRLSREQLEKASVRTGFYLAAQQWLLLFGALAYLAGHVWHLAAE